ncbi:MAG: type II toxin-antitoxin system HicA family toxin [Chloroflexota bacterium]
MPTGPGTRPFKPLTGDKGGVIVKSHQCRYRGGEPISPRLPRITARELLSALRRDGWAVERQRGSHVQLWHSEKKGLVTVANHPGRILKPKTLQSTLERAGLSVDDLTRLL